MKILTTLEMIDDYIKSNHTKKYRELEKGDNDECDIVSNGGGIDGWLCWGGDSKFMFPISRHNLTLKWEEVKQPYTFLEALKMMENGNKMRSDFSDYIYTLKKGIRKFNGKELDGAETSSELAYPEIKGRWFKED